MAEAAIASAVIMIGKVAINVLSSWPDVHDDLRWLERELEYMRLFLQNAEAREHEDLLVSQWLLDIKELSEGATSELKDYIQPRTVRDLIRHPFTSKAHRFAKQIKSFRQRLDDLKDRRERYGIQHIGRSGEGTNRILKRTDSGRNQEAFIGFEDIFWPLSNEILYGQSSRKVVSIYGMGGLGKTALAKELYNYAAATNAFNCCAWVHVTRKYRPDDLVQMTISSLRRYMDPEDNYLLQNMGEFGHEGFLRRFLEPRRYLIVIDDVWDAQVWNILRNSFPNNDTHSRVIITTRKRSVGVSAGSERSVHKLRFLNFEESMNLFTSMLINHQMSPAMRDLAGSLVTKCGGLPLALIQLGRYLNQKYDLAFWRMLNEDNIWARLMNYLDNVRDSKEFLDVFTLCYDYFSRDKRRPLLLIMGMFPDDHEVDVDKLLNMWMTEIEDDDTREDSSAEGFLKKLIDLCLVAEVGSFWGKPTTCKVIHGLLRYLMVEKAKEIMHFDIFPPRNYLPGDKVSMPSERHAIHGQASEYVHSLELSRKGKHNKDVRTLLFFTSGVDVASRLAYECANFECLEVLDVTGIDFSSEQAQRSLSEMLRKIGSLKFLVLAGTSIIAIPRYIVNHKNLQYLDIGFNSVYQLPREIGELKKLSNLHGVFDGDLPLHLGRQTSLKSVRMLRYPIADVQREMSQMKHVQELSFTRLTPADFSLMLTTHLRSLVTLVISWNWDDPNFPDLYSCACSNLWLDGPLVSLPHSDRFPKFLQRLILSRSKLRYNPMPALGRLPNLTSLELMNAYDGEDLLCLVNYFPELRYLRVHAARNLRNFVVEERAMPRMQGLTISECPQLINRPERFNDFPDVGRTNSVYGIPEYSEYHPPQL